MPNPLYDDIIDRTRDQITQMTDLVFRRVIACVLNLSTRTNRYLSTNISMIANYQSKTKPVNWPMENHVVRYLIGAPDHGIFLPNRCEHADILRWRKADWVGNQLNRRSRTGVLITSTDCPIIWTSKSQAPTVLSSNKAEFDALQYSAKELKWLAIVVIKLHVNDSIPTTMMMDDLNPIPWTQDVNGFPKVQHVCLKYNCVQDFV